MGTLCAISKEHARHGRIGYWFAFHPSQKERLSAYPNAFVAFGCGSADQILVFPLEQFIKWLPHLGKTEKDNRFYWHVILHKAGDKFTLETKAEFESIDVSQHVI